MPEPIINPHIKPTPEELEAENARIIAEAEAASPEEDEEEVEEETPEPVVEVEIPEEPDEDETVVVEEEPEEETPEPVIPDLKERYANSTREAQRLYKNQTSMNQALADANALPEPTEEELRSVYKDWDSFSDDQRETKTELYINRRFREHINQASQEIRSIQDWADKVEKFADDPQTFIDYPELDSKTKIEQFKIFAGDKSVQGTNFDILVAAFLHELSKSVKPKHTGQMFETGKGGPNDKGKPRSDKLSISESANLAKNDYRKYVEYLRAGKISSETD